MFIRTKNGKVFDCYVSEQMGKLIYYSKNSKTNGYVDWNEVYKKSENIIDVLEVGDYVNGYKVTKINIKAPITNNKAIECGINSYGSSITYVYDNKDIKSIVTKEQFEQMKYKVVE